MVIFVTLSLRLSRSKGTDLSVSLLVRRVPGTVVAAQLEPEGVGPDFARC